MTAHKAQETMSLLRKLFDKRIISKSAKFNNKLDDTKLKVLLNENKSIILGGRVSLLPFSMGHIVISTFIGVVWYQMKGIGEPINKAVNPTKLPE